MLREILQKKGDMKKGSTTLKVRKMYGVNIRKQLPVLIWIYQVLLMTDSKKSEVSLGLFLIQVIPEPGIDLQKAIHTSLKIKPATEECISMLNLMVRLLYLPALIQVLKN